MARKRKPGPTSVYHVGYNRALSAAQAYGTTRLIPSIAERQEFSYAWGEFMQGWKQGLREAAKDA